MNRVFRMRSVPFVVRQNWFDVPAALWSDSFPTLWMREDGVHGLIVSPSSVWWTRLLAVGPVCCDLERTTGP